MDRADPATITALCRQPDTVCVCALDKATLTPLIERIEGFVDIRAPEALEESSPVMESSQ